MEFTNSEIKRINMIKSNFRKTKIINTFFIILFVIILGNLVLRLNMAFKIGNAIGLSTNEVLYLLAAPPNAKQWWHASEVSIAQLLTGVLGGVILLIIIPISMIGVKIQQKFSMKLISALEEKGYKFEIKK